MKAVAPGVLAAAIGWMVLPLSAAERPSADFHVPTQGDDAWSRRFAESQPNGLDGPLQTLDAAKRRVGKLRRAEPRRAKPVVVAIRGGTYLFGHPIEFSLDDYGTEQSPTIYAAYGREPVAKVVVHLEHLGRPIRGVRLDGQSLDEKALEVSTDGSFSLDVDFARLTVLY